MCTIFNWYPSKQIHNSIAVTRLSGRFTSQAVNPLAESSGVDGGGGDIDMAVEEFELKSGGVKRRRRCKSFR